MSFVRGVTWREWVGLGAGLLALVSVFLPWTQLTASSPGVEAALSALPADDVARSAWRSTFFAWFPPLLVLLAGVAVALFGRASSARTGGLPHLWLVAAGVALVSVVLGWVFIRYQFDGDVRAVLEAGGVSVAAGVGRDVGAVAILVSLAAAVLDVRAVRRESRRPRKPRRG